MELLHWELSVLTRAVGYQNLSGAAANIGISQPQLSRIVARIEGELNVVVLDRASRRKSGWTPVAYKLAELYSKSSRSLEKDLLQLVGDTQPSHLKIGTLEGLAPLASSFCNYVFKSTGIKTLELDVHDLNALEEHFFKSEYDLIFISREPGRKKFKYSRMLGYQSLDRIGKDGPVQVLSSFEFQTHSDVTGEKLETEKEARHLVSNSLVVRRAWLETYGGKGTLPTAVRREKGSGAAKSQPVYLIASDLLSPGIWEKISKFKTEVLRGT